MTSSTTTTGTGQLDTTGRTVRDVVEYSPELVNEVWCRKILRQILQALELSYARQQSHPAITPDSIALHANGDAALLAAATLPVEHPTEPDDLRALAMVIHYAITKELAPEGPLRGRTLEGYSDSLVNAVDRCMAADPRQRPQTIEQLRSLLGIVALGSPLPQTASARPVVPKVGAAPAAPPHSSASVGRLQRWLLIGAAASVLVASGVGLYALLQGQQAGDEVVLALPSAAVAGPAAATATATAPDSSTEELGMVMADGTRSAATLPSPPPAEAAPGTAPAAIPGAAPGDSAPNAGTEAAPISYKLRIRPWGTVYVNGVERGVSPPLKRLALPPGQHTIRLVNPNFPDRLIELDTATNRSGRISHNFSARSQQR